MYRHNFIGLVLLVIAASVAPPGARARTPEGFSVRAGNTVRVSATGEVKTARLEVFARTGEKLFDSQSGYGRGDGLNFWITRGLSDDVARF